MKTIGVLVLAICSLAINTAYGDEPKSYKVTLSDARIQSTEIAAGEYQLLVHRDEPKVQLMHTKTGNVIDAAADVESLGPKFDRTEIRTQEVDGVKQIVEIRIAGTNLRITFRKAS